MIERVMPNNLDAEQSAIGTMFLSNDALQRCIDELQKEHFYSEANGKIFETIKSLYEKNSKIDITTVTAELDNKKILKQVGGVEYLTEIINMVPTARNVDEYIKIIEEKAIRRRLIETSNQIAIKSYDSEDIEELLNTAETGILNVVKTKKGTAFQTIQQVLIQTQGNLEKLAQNKGEVTGIATGFREIDRITAGFQPNQLIIVAARPAMGKTAFALNLATNIASNTGKTVALFNMEMGAEQLAMRMLSSVGQIDGPKLSKGHLEHNDWRRVNEAISQLADTKIYMDDTTGMTMNEIRAKCRRLASSPNGLDIVIIDYLQLISGSARYAGQRQQEVSEISRSLKLMAMELKVPVVALAQLARSVESREDKRPLLSDLRESGSIEQDADIVAFLYREDYYTKEISIDEFTSKAEFIIGKHRNGPTATIDLIFKRNTNTFIDMDNNIGG